MIRRLSVSLLLILTIGLLACGGPRETDQAVVLGLVAPFARLPQIAQGAELAAEEIAAIGGLSVGGQRRALRIVVEDSENRPEAAVSHALKLINRDRAVALLGFPMSNNAIPVSRIAETQRIPLLSVLSTHPETTAGKKYAFRLSFLNSFQGEVLARFAHDELGARRAAVLVHAAGRYSSDVAQVFSNAFRTIGGEIVAFEEFTEDVPSIASQLEAIRSAGAEAIVIPNNATLALRHMREAREMGMTATFLGSDTWGAILPGEAVGVSDAYFCDLWSPDAPSEPSASFMKAFHERYGIEPLAQAALAYDAVQIIAQIIETQGSSEPEAIRKGLATPGRFVGVGGTLEFSGSGDPVRSVFIRRIEPDGGIRLHREIEP